MSRFSIGDWCYADGKVGMVYSVQEDGILVRQNGHVAFYKEDDSNVKIIDSFEVYDYEEAIDELLGKNLSYNDGKLNHVEIIFMIAYSKNGILLINGVDIKKLMYTYYALVDDAPMGKPMFRKEENG